MRQGSFNAPETAWVSGDAGFDRAERPFEAHYFSSTGTDENRRVPAGKVTVEVMKGFEYRFNRRAVDVGRIERKKW